ncbi:MAG: YicC family protein [Candidatus Methylacidiphilales bacterium]
MKSMTGFGRGSAEVHGWRIEMEVQSVNQKRGLDLNFLLPRDYTFLERILRQEAGRAAARGRLTLSLQIKAPPAPEGLRVNRARLKAAHREALELARDLGLAEPASLDFLLKLPGVLETPSPAPDPAVLEKAVLQATRTALANWNAFRQREGSHLVRELGRLLALIQKQVARLHKAAGQAKAHLGSSLKKRLREAGLELGRDDERVAKEIALLVERADVTEELARLDAHLDEARRIISSGGEVRPLEFLLQEIGREVNTVGSKSQSLAISRCVVTIKADLEKMREQIQNLE